MLTLADAADELYAVPPAEFLATRTRLVGAARGEKDRPLAAQIGKLRKPSVAAAVLNALVRSRPDLTERLVSVGEQLRAAQAIGHGTALTSLRPDRDALIADWLDAAGESARAADGALSSAAGEEIRDTVVAAIASAEATEAVLAGHLTRALSYSGFGEVDLSDAVVRTEGGVLLRVIPGLRWREASGSADPGSGAGADPAGEALPEPQHGSPEVGEAEARGDAGGEAGPGSEPGAGPDVASERGGAGDPERRERAIAGAAAAYGDAAAAVEVAKGAVAESSARLDGLKARVADLAAQLAIAEGELAAAYEQDADARAGVADAVKARQAAAARLAAAEVD